MITTPLTRITKCGRNSRRTHSEITKEGESFGSGNGLLIHDTAEFIGPWFVMVREGQGACWSGLSPVLVLSVAARAWLPRSR